MIDSDVPMPTFISVTDLMRITTLSRTSIYELIKTGELQAVKFLGKTVFEETAVRAWLSARTKAAKARQAA